VWSSRCCPLAGRGRSAIASRLVQAGGIDVGTSPETTSCDSADMQLKSEGGPLQRSNKIFHGFSAPATGRA
jgi:hypothetical protein